MVGIVLGRQRRPARLRGGRPAPGIGRRHQRIVTLAANPDHLVETSAVTQTGLTEEGDVRDQGRADALVPEDVGQDRLIRPERRPALLGSGTRIARSTSSAGSAAWSGSREMVVEDHALGGQAVQVGVSIRRSRSTQEAQVQAVADDGDDVHGRHCSKWRIGPEAASALGRPLIELAAYRVSEPRWWQPQPERPC